MRPSHRLELPAGLVERGRGGLLGGGRGDLHLGLVGLDLDAVGAGEAQERDEARRGRSRPRPRGPSRWASRRRPGARPRRRPRRPRRRGRRAGCAAWGSRISSPPRGLRGWDAGEAVPVPDRSGRSCRDRLRDLDALLERRRGGRAPRWSRRGGRRPSATRARGTRTVRVPPASRARTVATSLRPAHEARLHAPRRGADAELDAADDGHLARAGLDRAGLAGDDGVASRLALRAGADRSGR